MKKKILIVSAHPDDEVIGMGGTMKKHQKAGDELYWLIMTDAAGEQWSDAYRAQKEKEVKLVADFFRIKKVFRAGFPAMALNTISTADMCEAVTKSLEETKASIVYSPPPKDINTDHANVFDAVRVAVRGLPSSYVKEFIAYEIPTTTRFCDDTSFFVPNCYVDISKEIKEKVRALNVYKTEVRAFPHPRSPQGLEIAARERGLALGVECAEAFKIIKSVR